MSRKSKKMAPLPPEATPPLETVDQALKRLAEMISRGGSALRMERLAAEMISRWTGLLDADAMRERLDAIRDQLAEGVEAAEESAGEIDTDSKAAQAAHQHTLGAIRATHRAFERACERMPV